MAGDRRFIRITPRGECHLSDSRRLNPPAPRHRSHVALAVSLKPLPLHVGHRLSCPSPRHLVHQSFPDDVSFATRSRCLRSLSESTFADDIPSNLSAEVIRARPAEHSKHLWAPVPLQCLHVMDEIPAHPTDVRNAASVKNIVRRVCLYLIRNPPS